MCGRTCLTLDPQQVCCACKYKTPQPLKDKLKKTGGNDSKKSVEDSKTKDEQEETTDKDSFILPEWRSEYNCGRTYHPSYNIAPTDITPVLVSSHHFTSESDANERQSRVVIPMMWGMIPFWHKGDYRKHGLTTNNCRLEHLMESKLYRGPFRRGQRCVVICEGFYEWQTTKSAKPSERAVHFIHMPQTDENVKMFDKSTWKESNGSDISLLKMAGLFDIWEDENGDKMYSYSVITFESSKLMSWMHHRMPAILETEEQVDDWLDYKRVGFEEALTLLKPAKQLKWYRVSNIVNNSRNKSDQCNKPFELTQKLQKPVMNKTMAAWLNVRKRRELQTNDRNDTDDESQNECGGGGDASTSESEADNNPPKRPKFRDFKKSTT